MKKVGIAILTAAALAAGTYLLIQLLTTDRQRVERAVRGLATCLEKRDAASFCLLIAEDYKDNLGQNREALRARLTWGLAQLGSMSVRLDDLQVNVSGDAATVEFLGEATATGRRQGQQPPWRWQTRVRLALRKADGDWRVCEAEYALPPLATREEF